MIDDATPSSEEICNRLVVKLFNGIEVGDSDFMCNVYRNVL